MSKHLFSARFFDVKVRCLPIGGDHANWQCVLIHMDAIRASGKGKTPLAAYGKIEDEFERLREEIGNVAAFILNVKMEREEANADYR